MKLILALATTGILCLCQVHAEQKDLFLEVGKALFGPTDDEIWENEMSPAMASTYEMLVPKEECSDWESLYFYGEKKMNLTPYKHAEGQWVTRGKSKYNWPERLDCTFDRIKEKDKPVSIPILIERFKKDSAENKWYDFDIKVLTSDAKEAIIEFRMEIKPDESRTNKKNRLDQTQMTIERWVLSDDWQITLSYDFRPGYVEDKEKIPSWDKLKDKWLNRIKNVHFE